MICEQMTADVFKDLEVKSIQGTTMNIQRQIHETRLVALNVFLVSVTQLNEKYHLLPLMRTA